MRSELTGEQCVLCGTAASVRVSGTSFCAPCGLHHHKTGNDGAVSQLRPTNRRRFAVFGLLSSGLLLKVLAGAVAIAAVGSVAATTVLEDGDPVASSAPVVAAPAAAPVSTTAETPGTDGLVVVPDTLSFPEVANSQAIAAHEYAVAVQAWAECLAAAALDTDGGDFELETRCGPVPRAGDFGIVTDDGDLPPGHDPAGPGNSENAPGHDPAGPGNSENAPGHDPAGPGNPENAPGHDPAGPGNSENAPGHDPAGPGNSENAPGQDKPPKDDKDK